uniref:SFRICE_014032 n=1 Tax=Spodoptera frugiperda TaxID=7108 RepID=A0A2H1V300_SPOFR
MYKLVVLSCVLALAAAKPSGLGPLGLGFGHLGLGLGAPWGLGAHLAGPVVAPVAAPVLAAPVAHAPAVGVAGPAVVAAPLGGAAHNYRGPVSLAPGQPASILAQDGRPLDTLSVNADRAVHYTARAVDHANAAHGHLLGKRSAPFLGAAWSHAARIDVPALAPAHLAVPAAAHLGWRAPLVVLSCLVAAAAAGALLPYAAPLAYTAPLAYSAPFAYSAPILAPYAPNYRGPLSLAPGQPANILGADGRPLDTLDVNLDRSAHYTAKALDNAGLHILKKRSAPLIAPISRVAVAAPLVHSYAAPLAYSAPVISSRLAVAPISYAAPYAHYWK